jgi:hypothetical protein
MHETRWRTTLAIYLAAVTLLGVGGLSWFGSRSGALPGVVTSPAGTASPVASPGASPVASPVATQLPLYTPIPPSEARNVVGRLMMELTDRGFIPSRFENAVNSDIVITLTNTGTRPHTFTIDELDVDVSVAPGETKVITLESPPRLGQYIYYSNTPEDKALGMMGIMTIFI